MSDAPSTIARGQDDDCVLRFTLPGRNARGSLVRLGPLADVILGAHDYPPPIRQLLAEALVVTALLGSLLKDADSQLTLQAQTQDGIVDLLVCDFRSGELRGYVRHDAERLAKVGANPSLQTLFGKGFLAITFDLAATDQRYQGVVPLEGGTFAEACEQYFAQSEQIPTLIRTAVHLSGGHGIAAGMLVQHLAEGEVGRERLHVRMDHPDWEHVAVLGSSLRHAELINRELPLEDVLWRLFHEEGTITVEPLAALSRGCRCSPERFAATLRQFTSEALADMRDPDGTIPVDCAFCSKVFQIAP